MDITKIALADKFFDIVDNGNKTTTIRYKHRDYKIGDGQFYSDTSDKVLDIYITNVIYKTFGELNDSDALTDGFNGVEELKSELLGFYPTAKDKDEITKVSFYKK